MKKYRNIRKIIAAVIVGMLLGSCTPVFAEESSSDIDNMTFEELKIAYLELQLEYEKLKNELDGTSDEEEEPVIMDVNEFKEDIVASYNARGVVSKKYTSEELSEMTTQEMIDYYYDCVDAESYFYNKYANAAFEDINLMYLCRQYTKGLQEQKEACQDYFDTGDESEFNEYWNYGYYDRAYAIVELVDYYGIDFGDISSMRSSTEAKDAQDDSSLLNADVDPEKVETVQLLLNQIGFDCGEADGDPGLRTVKCIKRFQEMCGYEPADGIIDDELIEQLENYVYE